MIEIGDLLNDRWIVKQSFARGNGRNFLFYLVQDDQLRQRKALLKTVRKTDLPTIDLYEWRCQALKNEQQRLATLVSPTMPEPFDAFDLPTGEPALVYSLIGNARGNYVLRDWLQRWGFLDNRWNRRQIDKIAQFMYSLARYTEEMWRAGFVHGNLNPDHLYYLRDGVIRVTGATALCRHTDGQIAPGEPGLRNLTIGYQHPEHHRRASGDSQAPLNAARVRWNSYAALALDLIWGRDIRLECARRGQSCILLNGAIEKQLREDFPALRRDRFKNDNPDLHKALEDLFSLLKDCLKWGNKDLPEDTYERFLEVWDRLDRPDFSEELKIHQKEIEFRNEHNWSDRLFRTENRVPPVRENEESEFLVCDYEAPTVSGDSEGKGWRSGRYRVVDLSHPPRRRDELRHLYLRTFPDQGHYFLPGDIVPGVVRIPPKGKPRVDPAPWTRSNPRSVPKAGKRMRALSLGWRLTSLGGKGVVPLALVELEGSLRTYRVRQREGEHWIVCPLAGAFFNAEFLEGDGRHFGVVVDHPPDMKVLIGQHFFPRVMDQDDQGGIYFLLPVGEEHFVSCRLPLGDCPDPDKIRLGKKVPILVESVKDGRIVTRWDFAEGGANPEKDREYPGVIVRRRTGDTEIEVRFGPEQQWRGVINLQASSFPWGTPFRHWEPNQPVAVEVIKPRVRAGVPEYLVRYLDPRPSPPQVENVLREDMDCEATVLSALPSTRGVRVLLATGEGDARIEVEGLIAYGLVKSELRNLEEAYPEGTTVMVTVREIRSAQRQILLKRQYQT